MPKNYCFFSSAAKRLAKHLSFSALGFLLSGSTPNGPVSTPLIAVPEVALMEVGGSGATQRVKLGDRMILQAELKGVGDIAGQTVTIKSVDEGIELENIGWYLVQGTLSQNGSVRFIASPLKIGTLTLPPLLIVGKDNQTLAKTIPLSIVVEGPTASSDEKPQFIDVITVKLPLRYWLYLGVLISALIMLIRFLYLRYLKNRQRKHHEVRTPLPPEPDHILALRKIDELYTRNPFSPENLKVVSFGLSEIIKEFFSKRFKVEALESTTDEMLMLLRREALSGDQLRAIQLLFLELDQYKFTKIEDYPPVYEETQSNLKVKATLIIQKWALVNKQEGAFHEI